MDSVIEQLQNSRTLIRERIDSIQKGGQLNEVRIGAEFDALRRLMVRREQQLVEELRQRVRGKLSALSTLDHDLLRSLQRVQRSKVEAQSLMETDQEPRVSRQRWRALMARKLRVTQIVHDAMDEAVAQKEGVAELVVSGMAIGQITPSLPQPLMARRSLDRYRFAHQHRRHYDAVNPYLVSVFTKNGHQILLETTVPGFAAHFEDRAAVHRVCGFAICEFINL